MDSHNPTTNRPPLDWSRFSPPATWKQNGRETRGPCPVTGEGRTKAWAVPDDNVIGCRVCSGDGSGRLSGAEFRQHAVALGLIDVDLGAGRTGFHREIERWTWHTADDKPRDQVRREGCGSRDCSRCEGAATFKHWQPTEPTNTPPPRELMYLLPAGVPSGPGPVYAVEGASDTDAAVRLGLRAIGRTNARPSAASLKRLDTGAVYCVWPDHDPKDAAGYRQAVAWADAATAAGLTVKVVDPLVLRPDAPPGFDARDWIESLPAGATAATAGAALDAAVVDVDAIRERAGKAPVPSGTIDPASMAAPPPGAIPAGPVRMCFAESDLAGLIAETAAGRLRHVAESGEWLTWRDGNGWRPITYAGLLAAVALCGRQNLGTRTKAGDEYLTPRSGGQASTAAGVLRELMGWRGVESTAADWDRDPGLVGLPGAQLLDVRTGQQRPMVRDNLIRRRLAAVPADADAFARSRFSSVIHHVVPDAAEREYLQRRLGAALLGTPGLDDLIWLSGASGSGKGVAVAAWRAAFGEYAAVLPVSELIAGGNRGHLQWLAKLYGARILIADDVPPRALDVSVINRLLGSVLSAHLMRKGSFDFTLTAPVIATSNYPPQVDAADAGFRRRLRPIAAGPPIPERDQDPAVRASMTTAAECAAVIRWLIIGARAFAADGCPVPDSIRQRTADVVSSTPMAEFVATFTTGEWIESGELWRQWRAFKTARGEQSGGRRTFTARLQIDHGWRPERAGHGRTRGWRVPADACGRNESISLRGKDSLSYRDIDPVRPHASAPVDDFPTNALGRAGGGADDQESAGPPDQPTGNSAEHAPPLATTPANGNGAAPVDLAALIVAFGERPTDASAALRIGRFLVDAAERRGTLPEGATAGAAAAHLLQTAGGIH